MIFDMHSVEVVFMALTIWREARGELRQAKLGVAFCIMDRVHRPSWWGDDVLSVIFKRLQFTSMTHVGDPQLTAWPDKRRLQDWAAWLECLDVAQAVLEDRVPNPVQGADTYHDLSIATPASWGNPRFVAQLGRLMFYDTDYDHEAPLTGHVIA
jgi:N-acetylmuramoyl-L-alanine amidase